jgi:hypothetical protein
MKTYTVLFLYNRQYLSPQFINYNIWVTYQVPYKKLKLLSLREHMCSLRFFLVGYVYWSSFFFLCCVKKMFVVVTLLDFVLCILCPMVQVSLDCQVLFALRFSLKGY